MKKFLLLALFAVLGMAQSAFAQFSVTYQGKEINDGDLVICQAGESETGDGGAFELDEPIFKLEKGSAELMVTITIPSLKNGDFFSWCGIGGVVGKDDINNPPQCVPIASATTIGKWTKLKAIEYDGGVLPGTATMGLHAEFNQYITYSVKVEVAVNGQKERTFFLVYKYAEVEAGIDGVEAQSESVKFADNVCHYNFSVEVPRTLNVYGVDGKLAYQSVLSAAQGSVSLNGLQKGAYVYSVVENGKKANSGKLLVK